MGSVLLGMSFLAMVTLAFGSAVWTTERHRSRSENRDVTPPPPHVRRIR